MAVAPVFLALVLLGPPEGSSVEGPSPAATTSIQERPAGAIYDRREDEGFVLRRVGLGVTIFGTILGVGGVIAAYHNPCGKDGARGTNCEVDVRNTVALTMGIAALGSLTAGVTSMAVGYSLKKRQLRAGVALGRDGGGLVLTGRF